MIAGVRAAIVRLADPVSLEVRTDVEEEAVDVQLPGKLLVEPQHVAERGLGLVEEITGNDARHADVGDAAQRFGGAVIREHTEGVEADEDVFIRQGREGAVAAGDRVVEERLMREDQSRRDSKRGSDARGDVPRRLPSAFVVRQRGLVALTRGQVMTDESQQAITRVRSIGQRRHCGQLSHQRRSLLKQLAFQRVDILPPADDVDAFGEVQIFERGVDAHELAAQPVIELVDRIE